MNWKFDQTKNEWDLYIEGEELVKLKIICKPDNPVYKFTVKVYHSSFIVSKNYKNKLKQKNIVWLKKIQKKFKTEHELERYIEIKKILSEKYIKSLNII